MSAVPIIEYVESLLQNSIVELKYFKLIQTQHPTNFFIKRTINHIEKNIKTLNNIYYSIEDENYKFGGDEEIETDTIEADEYTIISSNESYKYSLYNDMEFYLNLEEIKRDIVQGDENIELMKILVPKGQSIHASPTINYLELLGHDWRIVDKKFMKSLEDIAEVNEE